MIAAFITVVLQNDGHFGTLSCENFAGFVTC